MILFLHSFLEFAFLFLSSSILILFGCGILFLMFSAFYFLFTELHEKHRLIMLSSSHIDDSNVSEFLKEQAS